MRRGATWGAEVGCEAWTGCDAQAKGSGGAGRGAGWRRKEVIRLKQKREEIRMDGK